MKRYRMVICAIVMLLLVSLAALEGCGTKEFAQPQGSEGSGQTVSADEDESDDSAISVSVSIDGKGFISKVSAQVTLAQDSSAFDALAKVADSVGGNKRYVSSINGLAEKQHGKLSGWKYSVNGTEPSISAGSYTLKDGDTVKWYYVNVEN